MRRKRILELSKEEVEATCDRYEVAIKDGYPWSRNKTASCVICRDPAIRRFNVVMLEGKTPYDAIKRDFNFDLSQIYRHWTTHLAPYIDPEFSRKTVLAAVDRVAAHKYYPTAGGETHQYRWVVKQLLIARKVLLEEIEGGMPLRVANAEALHDYIEVLMKIKDLIPLTHIQKPRPVGRPKVVEPKGIEEEITEEQEAEMLMAREKREQRKEAPNEQGQRDNPENSRRIHGGQADETLEEPQRARTQTTQTGG